MIVWIQKQQVKTWEHRMHDFINIPQTIQEDNLLKK